MKNITFKFELVDRPTKDNTYPVQLRITQNGRHTRKMSVIRVKSKKDFNKNAHQENWIRPSEANYRKWNQILSTEIEKIKEIYKSQLSNGDTSREKIIQEFDKKVEIPSFIQILKDRAEQIYLEGGIRNKRKYVGIINKLELYLKTIKKKDLLVTEFDTKFLTNFRTHLYAVKNIKDPSKTLHPNTISGMMSTLKAVVNHSICILKVMKKDDNPFNGTHYCGEIPTQRDQLTEDEITKIEQLNLEKGSLIWHCKNFFMFSFYMGGIRAGDLLQMKWYHITEDGRLKFQADKTNKLYNLSIHQDPLEIIKHYHTENSKPLDYVFPFLKNDSIYGQVTTTEQKLTLPLTVESKRLRDVNSKNSLINKYLKLISKQAGIDKNITCHISRHSFGRWAKDHNMDTLHLQRIYGHSSVRETETYMNGFPSNETDKMVASLFDKSYKQKGALSKLIYTMDDDGINKLVTFLEDGLNLKIQN